MAFRRRRPAGPSDPLVGLDPSGLPNAYRVPVADALRVRQQFLQLVGSLSDGPLKVRLGELSTRVDAGVMTTWETAQRAVEMERVVATLDPERVTAELKQARRSGADEAVVEALTARFASTQRLLDALDELRARLPVLEAQLGAAVARVAELALTRPDGSGLDAVASELDHLVIELEALRLASGELG